MKKMFIVVALICYPAQISFAEDGPHLSKLSANVMLIDAASVLISPGNPAKTLHYMPDELFPPIKNILVIVGGRLPTISRYPHGLFYNFFISDGKENWVKPMIQKKLSISAIPAIEIKVIP
jgi:hypothetical protein